MSLGNFQVTGDLGWPSPLKPQVYHSIFCMDLWSLFLITERRQSKQELIWEFTLQVLALKYPWTNGDQPHGTPPKSNKAEIISFSNLLELSPAVERFSCLFFLKFLLQSTIFHDYNYIIRGENNTWRPNKNLSLLWGGVKPTPSKQCWYWQWM